MNSEYIGYSELLYQLKLVGIITHKAHQENKQIDSKHRLRFLHLVSKLNEILNNELKEN